MDIVLFLRLEFNSEVIFYYLHFSYKNKTCAYVNLIKILVRDYESVII